MNFSLIKNSVIKYLRVHITSINRWKSPLNSKMQSAGSQTLRSPVEVVRVNWKRTQESGPCHTGELQPRARASGRVPPTRLPSFLRFSCFENLDEYQRLCDDRPWLTPFWHMPKSYQLKKKRCGNQSNILAEPGGGAVRGWAPGPHPTPSAPGRATRPRRPCGGNAVLF